MKLVHNKDESIDRKYGILKVSVTSPAYRNAQKVVEAKMSYGDQTCFIVEPDRQVKPEKVD